MKMSNAKDVRKILKALNIHDISKQEHIRIQAVLLKKKGYTIKQIIDITQKSEDAIEGWITAYNKAGIEGLKTKEKKKPSHFTITNDQKDRINELIADHKPRDYGLSGDFWSVSTLKQLVKDKYKAEYKSAKSYRELLKYCGFSYQKAEYTDKRKNNISQGHFKKRFEKKLKKGAISMWW